MLASKLRLRREYRTLPPAHTLNENGEPYPHRSSSADPLSPYHLRCASCDIQLAGSLLGPPVLTYEKPVTCWNCGAITIRNAPIRWLLRRWYRRQVAIRLRYVIDAMLGIETWSRPS